MRLQHLALFRGIGLDACAINLGCRMPLACASSEKSGNPLSRQSVEQFQEAHGGFAIWLDPFGMLDPQVVVNLLPELAVGVDLVRHCSDDRILHKLCQYALHPAHEQFITALDFLCTVSARRGQVRVFQKAARTYLRCARRRPNWNTL
jgi:hypothetical protein